MTCTCLLSCALLDTSWIVFSQDNTISKLVYKKRINVGIGWETVPVFYHWSKTQNIVLFNTNTRVTTVYIGAFFVLENIISKGGQILNFDSIYNKSVSKYEIKENNTGFLKQ